jgi:hypothetical protein
MSEIFQCHPTIQSHKHFLLISSRLYMAQFSSFSACCMFPLGTFLFSDVPELDPQLRIEVVSYVDPLCAYIPGLSPAIAASLYCEVLPSPLRILQHLRSLSSSVLNPSVQIFPLVACHIQSQMDFLPVLLFTESLYANSACGNTLS